eukprot:CAMPEP_0118854786 /NCGR_PEP_ID=MMETSP1163-20130328/2862_1 /TAXON_ID=124430 /ORGANISM="Phaeomonas parva, Strain CCMP2877" /LENGTH=104 /DNA_ID=CAMNT_0006787561 /DNA_START=536 /DNA_END=850 /DNA_ORIENTATION=+
MSSRRWGARPHRPPTTGARGEAAEQQKRSAADGPLGASAAAQQAQRRAGCGARGRGPASTGCTARLVTILYDAVALRSSCSTTLQYDCDGFAAGHNEKFDNAPY